MRDDKEQLTTDIEERLNDEQREKIRTIDSLDIGAYPRAMCVLVALEMKPATEIEIYEGNTDP